MIKFAAILVFLWSVAASSDMAAAPKDARVSFNGYGHIRIGMSQNDLERFIGTKLKSQYLEADETGCDYLAPETGHEGLSFMLIDQRIARIDISSPKIQTLSGARVGDTQDSVLALYGDRLRVTPHYYTAPNGSYLTMYSSDKRYGIRFETDRGKVTAYYAGTAEVIQYVEGCL